MKTVRWRVSLPLACWTVGIVWLVMWAVVAVVQELRRQEEVLLGQDSYLLEAWNDWKDPKFPRPPSNPHVSYPALQDDGQDPGWRPGRLRQLLEEPTTTCRRLTNLGGVVRCTDCHTCLVDGNKYICFDPDVRPVPGACLVYAVGVGGEVSWDKAMNVLNCSVFAFDMTLMNWGNTMLTEGLHFLDVGLHKFNSDDTINMTSPDPGSAHWQWRKAHFRTLEVIRDILGHNERPIDVLKLDIEFMEWDVLGEILSSPEKSRVLSDVRQIALEIHLDGLRNASAGQRVLEGRRVEAVLDGLRSHGFHMAHSELNTAQQVYAEVRGQVFPLYRESLFLRRP